MLEEEKMVADARESRTKARASDLTTAYIRNLPWRRKTHWRASSFRSCPRSFGVSPFPLLGDRVISPSLFHVGAASIELMRRAYRLVLLLLLLLMFRSPLLRLQQTARHLVQVIPEAISSPSRVAPHGVPGNMSRPSGLIANSGLELLTFGTPNGKRAATDHTTGWPFRSSPAQATKPLSSLKSSRRRTASPTTSSKASTSARTSRKSRGLRRRVPMAESPCSSITTMVGWVRQSTP